MADRTLQLITFLKADERIQNVTERIGETIYGPDGYPFIWIHQTGSEDKDCVNDNDEDSTFFDCEITGDDIEQIRDLTIDVKAAIRGMSWPTQFDSEVQYAQITDHSDEYEKKTNSDETAETGALQIRLFNG